MGKKIESIKSFEALQKTYPEEAGKYIKVDKGFVLKEAEENYQRAEKLAKIATVIHGRKTEATDILQKEALEFQRKLEQIRHDYIPENLRGDKEIVIEAVKRDGWALEFASKELRNDKEVVIEAVKEDGRALQFASEGLRSDLDIVLEAVRNREGAIKYASEEIKEKIGI